MAEAERPIAEDELHAYVDGQLDAARRTHVERYLYSHPEVARRVAADREQRSDLRSAFAAPAHEPIPPELNLMRLLEIRLRPRRALWRFAAAIVLALGIGGATGWYLALPAHPARIHLAMDLLQQEAMHSHAVFAADRRHPVEVAATESDHLAQWLSNRLHRRVAPFDLALSGYRLLGGRLLATEHGAAAALLMYEDTQGGRLSVLLRPMAPELHAAYADVRQGDVNGCAWIDQGIGYAVVAARPDEVLDRVADLISQQVHERG